MLAFTGPARRPEPKRLRLCIARHWPWPATYSPWSATCTPWRTNFQPQPSGLQEKTSRACGNLPTRRDSRGARYDRTQKRSAAATSSHQAKITKRRG